MTTESTIRAAVEAYDAGDVDAVNSMLHDDVLYRINSTDGPYCADCATRADFWSAVGEILADWDVQSYKIADLIVSGDKGAAEIDIRMKSKHTGRVVDTGLALFLEVRDGKLTSIHEYHDTQTAGTSRAA